MSNSEGSIEKLVSNDVKEFSDLKPRRPRFDNTPVHVRFIVGKVTVGQVLYQVLGFFHIMVIPPTISGNLEAT
jgi:hypothetical protein